MTSPESTTDLDTAALARLRRFGGDKLLGDMIALFIGAAPERLDAARRGAQVHDLNAIEMAMHSLKSSAAQLGAIRMQRLCAEGEQSARAGLFTGVPALLDEIDAELPRVTAWLAAAIEPGTE
jgi:HPt (histidine-containing phosphotransfer) domain-containing protein